MPAFANTLLGASVVLGVAVAIVSARGRLAVILRGGVVLVASVAYVAGYALFALAAGFESFAQPIFGVTAGLLLAVSTVVLSVAWGAYLGQFNLRQALCAGGYGGRGGAGGAAALIGHLRRGAYRVRGARSAFVLGALLVGMARALIAVREAGEAESRSRRRSVPWPS